MVLRPPTSTRTDTLFPSPTLFLSHNSSSICLRPIMGVSQGARAKYRLADPHQRGSFLDGDLEIAGHPHRQALETHSVRRAVTQRLAQVPHQPETAAHPLFIGLTRSEERGGGK